MRHHTRTLAAAVLAAGLAAGLALAVVAGGKPDTYHDVQGPATSQVVDAGPGSQPGLSAA